jgi:hypothetical protein
MAGRKGQQHRRPKTQRERDQYAITKIEELLDSVREGNESVDAARLRAIELRYSRLRPLLSSVEQTTIEEMPAEVDLMSKFRALLDVDPSLRAQLLALLTGHPQPIKPEAAQQSTAATGTNDL